jgi:hypothetical protein
MPQKDYRAYAQTPQGKAARARAHQKYVEKRRAMRESRPVQFNPKPLAEVVSAWRTQ